MMMMKVNLATMKIDKARLHPEPKEKAQSSL